MGQMLLFRKNDKENHIHPELKKIFEKLNKNGFLKTYFNKDELKALLNSSGNHLNKYNL